MATNIDATVILFTMAPLVGSSVGGEGAEPPAAVGGMSFVGTTAEVGIVVSTVVTEGCGDSEGAKVVVGWPDGAGDSDGAGEMVGVMVTMLVGAPDGASEKVGSALSATVGMSLGAGLEVGELVMLQSAFSIDEEISGIVRVSAVHPPSAQVNPREQALLTPTDSSGSQMPIGWGSSSHMRNN